MNELADTLTDSPAEAALIPRLRRGVVAQASPLLVTVGAATTATPCKSLGWYTPTLGDVVSVLVVDGDRLVLGTTH